MTAVTRHGFNTSPDKVFCGKDLDKNEVVAATSNLATIDCPYCIKSIQYGGPEVVPYQVVDFINPAHYKDLPNGIECVDVTQFFNFNLGNAIKYVWRAGKKTTDPVQDLQKAIRYLEFEIERIKNHGN